METVNQVLPLACELGEGCVWDQENQSLYFVDITSCMVYRLRTEDNHLASRRLPGPVGCVVPEVSGGIIAASGHSLYYLDKDLEREEVGILPLVFSDTLRFNDGKCDPWGCLWLGTMAGDQSREEAYGEGSLLCIKDLQLISEYSGYTIPNGMAWSADRGTFYHIDTRLQRVDRYDVEGRGKISGRRTAVSVPEEDGSPDGMCMDCQGNLWIAMWGAGKAACYSPDTGQKLCEIPVPARNVSCVTFGGPDLQTLYITTAKDQEGHGGGLYSVRVPVKGLPAFVYKQGKSPSQSWAEMGGKSPSQHTAERGKKEGRRE